MTTPPHILFVDDDIYPSHIYVRALEREGMRADYARGVDDALQKASEVEYGAVILDVMMPPGKSLDEVETQGGYKTGIVLSREFIKRFPLARMIALTLSNDPEAIEWFTQNERFAYFNKRDFTPESFAEEIKRLLKDEPALPNVFIVHGHDHSAALALKNFLQNMLGLGEPTILAEKPARGHTIIEKFEEYAQKTDLVFALFTPDDFREEGTQTGRARQNVVFEFGYFLGRLGRHAGKVFLLLKRGVELPSDLHGVIYIDITDGIEAAGESIRRELELLRKRKSS